MDNRGFTLVEVLAVIVIIGVVSGIAAPGVLSLINTSKNKSYDIMIDDIRVASEKMYEEVEFLGVSNGNDIIVEEIALYNMGGKDTDSVKINIASKVMEINLQTLVGNGFLTGSSNDGSGSNENKRVIKEPRNNEDIGDCVINITKVVNEVNNKVCYKIESHEDNANKCPSTDLFGGNSQCTS